MDANRKNNLYLSLLPLHTVFNYDDIVFCGYIRGKKQKNQRVFYTICMPVSSTIYNFLSGYIRIPVYAESAGESDLAAGSLTDIAVVDTTGAGDIFGGSAVWMLLQLDTAPEALEEAQLEKIVRFACTSAALSTTRPGGISSVPEYGDVLARLER